MHPLAGDFQQPENAHFGNLHAGAILLHRLFHPFFNRVVVGRLVHINKVNDNQPGQIAHPQLFGDFVGRLKVGLQGGFLYVHFFGGAAGVDVYGNKRLGRVNHEIAAGSQLNNRIVQFVKLFFHLILLENRNVAGLAAFYFAPHVR